MTALRAKTRRTHDSLAALALARAAIADDSNPNGDGAGLAATTPSASIATPVSQSSSNNGLDKGTVAAIAVVCSVVPVLLALLVITIVVRTKRRRAAGNNPSDHTIRGPYPLTPGSRSPSMDEKGYHRARTGSSLSAHGSSRPRAGTAATTISIPSMLAAADAPSALSPAPSVSRSPSLFSGNSIGYRSKRSSHSNPNLPQGFYTTRSTRMTQSQATFKSFATASEFDTLAPIMDLPTLPSPCLPNSPPPPRPPRPETTTSFVPTYLIPDMESSLGHGSDYASVDHGTIRSFKYDSIRSYSTTSHSVSGSISSPFVDCPPSLISHPFNRTTTPTNADPNSASSDLRTPSLNGHDGFPHYAAEPQTPPAPPALSRRSSVPRSPLRPPPRPRPNHPKV